MIFTHTSSLFPSQSSNCLNHHYRSFHQAETQDILLTSVENSKDAQIGGYDSVLVVGFLEHTTQQDA